MPRPVAEWIGKLPTTAIPDRVRLRVFDRFFGRCAFCGNKIFPGDLQIDHKVALINGGFNRESNLEPLHRACHTAKTAGDVEQKARMYRKRRKHVLGKRLRSITAWRKFNGEIVRRPRER